MKAQNKFASAALFFYKLYLGMLTNAAMCKERKRVVGMAQEIRHRDKCLFIICTILIYLIVQQDERTHLTLRRNFLLHINLDT